MDKNLLISKVEELLKTNACEELKAAAKNYLDQVGKDGEDKALVDLYQEIEEDIIPVDGLIEFCKSEHAKKLFGEETADKFYKHGLELKKEGALYCDCPACAKAVEILELK